MNDIFTGLNNCVSVTDKNGVVYTFDPTTIKKVIQYEYNSNFPTTPQPFTPASIVALGITPASIAALGNSDITHTTHLFDEVTSLTINLSLHEIEQQIRKQFMDKHIDRVMDE
jgi:hypothetical protein